VAVDGFIPSYDEDLKRANLDVVAGFDGCEFVEADLMVADLADLLTGIDVVFHLAGHAGVRSSWADGFDSYVTNNIRVTQRLLEASRGRSLQRFVLASSSSVYGNSGLYPSSENDAPAPHSPYGVTKLAAEHLAVLYARNWAVPTVSLRYFTVYGPRQRPDMAMHRIIESCLGGDEFHVFGDGEQIRDFTFVGDVVEATVQAATVEVPPGTVVNVAGGSAVTLESVIAMVEQIVGRSLSITYDPDQPGDVRRTGGDTGAIRALLGWQPRVDLRSGLEAQVLWHAEDEQNRLAGVP